MLASDRSAHKIHHAFHGHAELDNATAVSIHIMLSVDGEKVTSTRRMSEASALLLCGKTLTQADICQEELDAPSSLARLGRLWPRQPQKGLCYHSLLHHTSGVISKTLE